MKSPSGYPRIYIGFLALVLATFACNLGAHPSTTSPQQAPTSVVQPTQPPPATSSTRGTPDEAKAMLQKAVEHYNSVGRKQALADFTGRVAPFFDRDLYVACIDSQLIQSANGGFPNLVGSSIEPISRAAWDAASKNNIGSVSYQWIDPANGQTEPKTFFYEKVGSDVCGVGAYNP
jgi:cytochrome c